MRVTSPDASSTSPETIDFESLLQQAIQDPEGFIAQGGFIFTDNSTTIIAVRSNAGETEEVSGIISRREHDTELHEVFQIEKGKILFFMENYPNAYRLLILMAYEGVGRKVHFSRDDHIPPLGYLVIEVLDDIKLFEG